MHSTRLSIRYWRRSLLKKREELEKKKQHDKEERPVPRQRKKYLCHDAHLHQTLLDCSLLACSSLKTCRGLSVHESLLHASHSVPSDIRVVRCAEEEKSKDEKIRKSHIKRKREKSLALPMKKGSGWR